MSDIKNNLKLSGLVGSFGQAMETGSVVEKVCDNNCLILTAMGCTSCTYAMSQGCNKSCAVTMSNAGGC